MARKVIESKIVNNAAELVALVQRFATIARLDEINIEEPRLRIYRTEPCPSLGRCPRQSSCRASGRTDHCAVR